MARKKSPGPTDRELAILGVLWERGAGTVREVHEALDDDAQTGYTTTLKLMQIMVEKGLLVREDDASFVSRTSRPRIADGTSTGPPSRRSGRRKSFCRTCSIGSSQARRPSSSCGPCPPGKSRRRNSRKSGRCWTKSRENDYATVGEPVLAKHDRTIGLDARALSVAGDCGRPAAGGAAATPAPRRANLRYAVACGALALMAVLPLITMQLVEVPGPVAEAGPPPAVSLPAAATPVIVDMVDELPPMHRCRPWRRRI